MKVDKLVAVFGLVLGLSVSQGAAAQSRSATAREAEEAIADPNRTPFSGSVGLSTSVGSGTFIADKYSDMPRVVQSLSLSGTYRIDALPFLALFSVSQGFSFEYTDPAARTGRKWDYQDLSFGFNAPNIWYHEETGLALTTSLGVSLPTSFGSRQTNKYAGVGGGLSLGMPVGPIYAYGSLGLSKNFYRYTNVVVTQEDVTFGDEFGAYCRNGQAYCRGGPYLTSWGMRASIGASYAIPFLERLSTNAMLGWSTGWTFSPPEEDEFTSPLLEDGTRTRQMDFISAGLGLSYNYSQLISLSGGVNTNQPWLTSDQKGIRNPLYNKYRRSNSTSLYLSLSAGF